ncbi:MAG: hypothetical protein JWO09_1268 [Bacteroidetes bacterium]|nr:hypothetical protein [Bacteroidota bacterium]
MIMLGKRIKNSYAKVRKNVLISANKRTQMPNGFAFRDSPIFSIFVVKTND